MVQERMKRGVALLGKKDVEDMLATEEVIEVNCHFCNDTYSFSADEIRVSLDEVQTAAAADTRGVDADEECGGGVDDKEHMQVGGAEEDLFLPPFTASGELWRTVNDAWGTWKEPGEEADLVDAETTAQAQK
jgi:hypothetical protein